MLRGFEKIKTSINFSGFKLFSQDEKKKNRPNKKRMDLKINISFLCQIQFLPRWVHDQRCSRLDRYPDDVKSSPTLLVSWCKISCFCTIWSLRNPKSLVNPDYYDAKNFLGSNTFFRILHSSFVADWTHLSNHSCAKMFRKLHFQLHFQLQKK